MAFKFIIVLASIAVASAGIIPVHHQEGPQEHHIYQQPAAVYQHSVPTAHVAAPQHVVLQKEHHEHEQYPNDPHPQYNFSYDVQDAISGDSKSQSETRDGDVVHGEYSLNDADGFRRTVKYTADDVNGFNAVVHREPLVGHKVVAAAPVAYATAPKYHDHHDQHAAYTTYEAPHHGAHEDYHH